MPSASIFMKAMEVIQANIVALNLPGIAGISNVLVQKSPSTLERYLPLTGPFPLIIIAPSITTPDGLNPNAGTNLKDELVHPILVAMLDKDNNDQSANFDNYLLWREKIILNHSNRHFSTIPEVTRVTVQPGTIVDPGAWANGKWISGIQIMVTTRRTRIA